MKIKKTRKIAWELIRCHQRWSTWPTTRYQNTVILGVQFKKHSTEFLLRESCRTEYCYVSGSKNNMQKISSMCTIGAISMRTCSRSSRQTVRSSKWLSMPESWRKTKTSGRVSLRFRRKLSSSLTRWSECSRLMCTNSIHRLMTWKCWETLAVVVKRKRSRPRS